MFARLSIALVIGFVQCKTSKNLSSFIIGGEHANIRKFPHSVLIVLEDEYEVFVCGGSILNQFIILTAAHCLDARPVGHRHISTFVGHKHRDAGFESPVLNYTVHMLFDIRYLIHDIALMRLIKELQFGMYVSRVMVMEHPPHDVNASVAGWGATEDKSFSVYLKRIEQRICLPEYCHDLGMHNMPAGTICGEHPDKTGHPNFGDSGSALIIRNNIQVGIVSHMVPTVSKTITVYTDTRPYYDWIKTNSEDLYCADYN